MPKHLYIFLILIIFTPISGQTLSCDTLYWNGKRKLSWDNFKAQPDTNSKFGAISVPSIGYSLRLAEDTSDVQTYCRFLTCRSWTNYQPANLLKHEQTHLDISELCRRTFISKLKKRVLNSHNAVSIVEAAYKDIQKLREELNKKYDLETIFLAIKINRTNGQKLFRIKSNK